MATMEISPFDRDTHTWTGVCPVCKKETQFDVGHSGQNFVFHTANLTTQSFATGGAAFAKYIFTPTAIQIGCVECGHSMAICKNCQIAFSTAPNKLFHKCPSCTKEYT